VQLLAAIILGYFFYLMSIHGWQLVERTMNQRSSALRYPMGYAYAALPVSGAVMFLFNLETILRIVRSWRTGEPLREEGE
jgi:TRAP-type C4-dicarboxylate transport system permease small subunit